MHEKLSHGSYESLTAVNNKLISEFEQLYQQVEENRRSHGITDGYILDQLERKNTADLNRMHKILRGLKAHGHDIATLQKQYKELGGQF